MTSVTVGSPPIRQFAYDGAINITSDARLGSVYGYTYNHTHCKTTVSLDGTLDET